MNRVVFIGAIAPALNNKITPGVLPFGILSIASYLRKNGIESKIISTAFPDSFIEIKKSFPCDFVGISSMSGPYLKYAIVVAEWARKYYPKTKIIWGGPHASLFKDSLIEEGYADIVVQGVGEKQMLKIIQGDLSYCKEDFDINEFPDIDYSFIKKKYMDSMPEYNYFSSRGCPYRCSFCVASTIYNRKWYSKTVDKVKGELKEAQDKYNFNTVLFWDDNLFVDIDRLYKIIDGTNFKWKGYARIDRFAKLSDNTIYEFKKKGLSWVSFGVESGSQKTLNALNKEITAEQVRTVASKLDRCGLMVDFSFMGGIPGETYEDFAETLKVIKYIKKINRNYSVRLFRFTPYPGMAITKNIPLPKMNKEWVDIYYQKSNFFWVSKDINRVLDVFSAAGMYSEKPKNYGILFVLYSIYIFRIKYGIFVFPVESRLINFLNGIINKARIAKFKRRLFC
jgi:radical SAM superfamily enzyme YgiQ (UPF0313 family)